MPSSTSGRSQGTGARLLLCQPPQPAPIHLSSPPSSPSSFPRAHPLQEPAAEPPPPILQEPAAEPPLLLWITSPDPISFTTPPTASPSTRSTADRLTSGLPPDKLHPIPRRPPHLRPPPRQTPPASIPEAPSPSASTKPPLGSTAETTPSINTAGASSLAAPTPIPLFHHSGSRPKSADGSPS